MFSKLLTPQAHPLFSHTFPMGIASYHDLLFSSLLSFSIPMDRDLGQSRERSLTHMLSLQI